MTENNFWISLWLGLALIIATTACFIAKESYKMDREYAKAGYKRTYISGMGMQWVRGEKAVPAE